MRRVLARADQRGHQPGQGAGEERGRHVGQAHLLDRGRLHAHGRRRHREQEVLRPPGRAGAGHLPAGGEPGQQDELGEQLPPDMGRQHLGPALALVRGDRLEAVGDPGAPGHPGDVAGQRDHGVAGQRQRPLGHGQTPQHDVAGHDAGEDAAQLGEAGHVHRPGPERERDRDQRQDLLP